MRPWLTLTKANREKERKKGFISYPTCGLLFCKASQIKNISRGLTHYCTFLLRRGRFLSASSRARPAINTLAWFVLELRIIKTITPSLKLLPFFLITTCEGEKERKKELASRTKKVLPEFGNKKADDKWSVLTRCLFCLEKATWK